MAWTIIALPNAAIAAETVASRQLVCQTIADAAAANGLPASFLARLLWTESGFRSSAISPAGAIGVAQFMPQTAAEQGLADPRDPLAAIYHAARLLIELERHFGNLGLAAAAYNAGAARVTKWLQGQSGLPLETEVYVRAITGRRAEDWATMRGTLAADDGFPLPGLDCLISRLRGRRMWGRFPSPPPGSCGSTLILPRPSICPSSFCAPIRIAQRRSAPPHPPTRSRSARRSACEGFHATCSMTGEGADASGFKSLSFYRSLSLQAHSSPRAPRGVYKR